MREHNEIPGSPEWRARRRRMWNASEAPAVLNCSQHITRDQLLYAKHTGEELEVSDQVEAARAEGHRTEALARPVVENWTGQTLYPIGGSIDIGLSMPVGASLDGTPMSQGWNFEHKLLNETLRAALPHKGWQGAQLNDAANLPKDYRVQLEQQLMVNSDAERTLFMASEWDGQVLKDARLCWYVSDPALRKELLLALNQIDAELKEYVVPPVRPKAPIGAAIEQLPALMVEVEGRVVASNLVEWQRAAVAHIQRINEDLNTEQDFADAATAVKWCADQADNLKAAKRLMLAKMMTVNELFTTLDTVVSVLDEKRLSLDGLVSTRKSQIRKEKVDAGVKRLNDYIDANRENLLPLLPAGADPARFKFPMVSSDFWGAIKSKRTVPTVENAVNSELARCKIEVAQLHDRLAANLRAIKAAGQDHLFTDWREQIVKDPETVEMVIQQRVQAEATRKAAEDAASKQREDAAAAALTLNVTVQDQVTPPRSTGYGGGPIGTRVDYGHSQARGDVMVGTSPHDYRRVYDPNLAHARAPDEEPQLSDEPTLKAGDICSRLGATMTLDFIAELGFKPHGENNRKLFSERQFYRLCNAYIKFIELQRDEARQPA